MTGATKTKKNNAGLVIFNNHSDAERAVKELQKAGYDMRPR